MGSQTVDSRYNKQVLFRIASSEYLLPSTSCLNFKVTAPHKNIRGQEMLALALLDAVTLTIGGIEVEYVQEVGLLAKELIHHSVSPQTYENTYDGMLGAWKYKKRAAAYVKHNVGGEHGLTSDPAANPTVRGALAPGEAATTYVGAPWEGRVYREDSFPISDKEGSLLEADGGQEYSVPLHLILGCFRLKNLLPVWAMGKFVAQAPMQMVC